MIASAVAAEIQILLAEGRLSQRKIAKRLGVSRGTVHAIARGKRPAHEAWHRLSPDSLLMRPRDSLVRPSGLFRRCPTCGGMVQTPCLACYVRKLREHDHAAAAAR